MKAVSAPGLGAEEERDYISFGCCVMCQGI